ADRRRGRRECRKKRANRNRRRSRDRGGSRSKRGRRGTELAPAVHAGRRKRGGICPHVHAGNERPRLLRQRGQNRLSRRGIACAWPAGSAGGSKAESGGGHRPQAEKRALSASRGRRGR